MSMNESCCEFGKVSESSWVVVGVEVTGEADAESSCFKS